MMFKRISLGSIAPLALLFTLVSMTFTAAYLKNSFTQTAMEKYRYAEWKALYAAEAGLNDVGVIVLPFITGDTLLLQSGVEYGEDENGEPIGTYKDIACSTKLIPGTTDNLYIAWSTGVAKYRTPAGTDVTLERDVYTTMVPEGFEDFMYFTDEEEPIGPGNTGTVNFGGSDTLEGQVHTNGTMVMSNYGCPTFLGEVSVTFEAIENGGGVSYAACDDVFEMDEDGETISILDTVGSISWPPSNSAKVTRQHASRVFEADDKLFRTGKKDTMIMTEINFVSGGYYATQWWYNIPPVGTPPVEYDFYYDSTETGVNCSPSTMHLFQNNFDGTTNTYINANFLMLSALDINGDNVQDEISELIQNGDLIRIENSDGSKYITFTATSAGPFGANDTRVSFETESLIYFGPPGEGFNPFEAVTFINTSATTGLAADVEWNTFHYYHDHTDAAGFYCEAGRIQHFDFEYWTAGGTGCDIFNCSDLIYTSEYVHMNKTFFPKGNSPHVLYIKGGQVLVRGTVDGQYTIVTDDYTEYRRHDNNSIIDRVWGNIWLIDDIVYEDSYSSGKTIHPDDGGTENVLGLIAGGSVIIANTRPNGARDQQYGSDIKINAAIMAMYGGFISHYWQNTLLNYHGAVEVTWNGITTVIADGRGGHRNYYHAQTGNAPNYNGVFTDNSDYRGYVNLWGSIVQYKRGYMLRNASGPYNVNAPGVGYDKNYHYDWNLRIHRPPYYPNRENEDGSVSLNMSSYGERKTQN
jgi:hypothetical protein